MSIIRKTLEKHLLGQGILPSALALTVYIQLSLMISVLVIDSHVMGFTSTNHGNGHIEINSVKD
jgi:hypothetical protein